MERSDTRALLRMARTHPVRTSVFSVGPLLFGLAQMVHSFLTDGSLLFAALFLCAMAIFASMVTRYHLVTFRIHQLDEQFGTFE